MSTLSFLRWLRIEQAGLTLINSLTDLFPSVEILEHYNDYYKLRVPKGDRTIGFVFGMIEDRKDEMCISEYSVSQTTLEQIFQTFANIQIDDNSKPMLKFSRKPQNDTRKHRNDEHDQLMRLE